MCYKTIYSYEWSTENKFYFVKYRISAPLKTEGITTYIEVIVDLNANSVCKF